MAQAKQGDTVRVHYTGTLNDGTVFDSSQGRDPLEFTVGQGRVIPGFEQAVVGMDLGESRTTNIPVPQAYGPRDEKLIMRIDRQQVPADVELAVDDQVQLRRRDGGMAIATVTEITESTVTLDGNHPLAGKDLTFDIELVEIL
jgi:FKBP-type peptidyl-prolyl cis-trans isomerase 2